MSKRHNEEPSYGKKDFGSTTVNSEHDDLNVHHSFPSRKQPMNVNDHPHDNNRVTEHEDGHPSGVTVEKPQTTKTGSSKAVGAPFKGMNS